jgi:putative spermidine/putrescine transport system permease protein
MSDLLTTDAGTSPAGVSGEVSAPRASAGALVRKIRTGLPVVPFLVYITLGLLLPALEIINYAFRSDSGKPTLANIRTILSSGHVVNGVRNGGQYLAGFENSLKLALVTSIVPGILGTFVAYAIATSKHEMFKRLTAACSGVLSQFGGVNLAFMFVAAFGALSGVATHWLANIGLNPWDHGFNLYKFWGVAFVYMYFQIPLMILIITPAFAGLKESWREAAENLGASSWRYWRHVGLPVLAPAVLGSMFLLFGSGFSAYATGEALTAGSIAITPIQIGAILQGNVLANQANIGYALGFAMIVILLFSVIGYALLRKRTSRWLR